MHYLDAIKRIRCLCSDPPTESRVTFVSPIVSAMLAAALADSSIPVREHTVFDDEAMGYADNCGLLAAIQGKYEFPQPSGRQGSRYTKLTRLSSHDEVDRCNSIINDLIFEHFENFGPVASRLAKVVGELHDNVASHARGLGFSCAQVYNNRDDSKRIEFAIADGGRGMLRNVRRVLPDMTSHAAAIKWCLERGNTTAGNVDSDGWAQRLPDDAGISPYPTTAKVRRNEDHHIGEGLWKLAELTKSLGGKLWVATGDGEVLLKSHQEIEGGNRINWTGVAIELELTVSSDYQPTPAQQSGIEQIASRLGWEQ